MSQEPATDRPAVRRFIDPAIPAIARHLGEVREGIDQLDTQIVALLARRALLVQDATRFKADAFQVAAPARQAAGLRPRAGAGAGPAGPVPAIRRHRRGHLSHDGCRVHRLRAALLRPNRARAGLGAIPITHANNAPSRQRHAMIRSLFAPLLAAFVLMPSVAAAQAWPQRPVKIVIPYGSGPSPDVLARILAERRARAGPAGGDRVPCRCWRQCRHRRRGEGGGRRLHLRGQHQRPAGQQQQAPELNEER